MINLANYRNDRLYDQRVNKKYILPLAEYIYIYLSIFNTKYFFGLFRFIQVIEDNISIVIFDAHGSTGQDESYLKSNFQDWFERQYQDYIKVAK